MTLCVSGGHLLLCDYIHLDLKVCLANFVSLDLNGVCQSLGSLHRSILCTCVLRLNPNRSRLFRICLRVNSCKSLKRLRLRLCFDRFRLDDRTHGCKRVLRHQHTSLVPHGFRSRRALPLRLLGLLFLLVQLLRHRFVHIPRPSHVIDIRFHIVLFSLFVVHVDLP